MGKLTSGQGSLLADASVTWADSAGSGTEKQVSVPLPEQQPPGGKYLVIVRNPSTETALTVDVEGREDAWSGGNRFPAHTAEQEAVPSDTPDGKAFLVEGWLLGDGGRLTISNDSGLTASGGFTADVRVRRV